MEISTFCQILEVKKYQLKLRKQYQIQRQGKGALVVTPREKPEEAQDTFSVENAGHKKIQFFEFQVEFGQADAQLADNEQEVFEECAQLQTEFEFDY